MPAYVIVDVDVKDSADYDTYRPLSGASVEQYGGRFLARGGVVEGVEGDWKPSRLVIIEFPTIEQARIWYNFARIHTRERDPAPRGGFAADHRRGRRLTIRATKRHEFTNERSLVNLSRGSDR